MMMSAFMIQGLKPGATEVKGTAGAEASQEELALILGPRPETESKNPAALNSPQERHGEELVAAVSARPAAES